MTLKMFNNTKNQSLRVKNKMPNIINQQKL